MKCTASKYALVLLITSLGCAIEQAVEVAPDPSRPNGVILSTTDIAQVREADLRRAFPALRAENRLESSCRAEWDPLAKAFFAPSPVSEHAVETNFVTCNGRGGLGVACSLERAPAYFVSDPTRYFALEGDIAVDEALAVVRLFEEGALAVQGGSAADRPERPYTIRKREQDYVLQVGWTSCGGCSRMLSVTPVLDGGTMVGLSLHGGIVEACSQSVPTWLAGGPVGSTAAK